MKSIWALGLGAVLSVATACGDDDGSKSPDRDSGTDGGSITLPDGAVVGPDGSTVLPDGAVIGPDGSVIDPDGGNPVGTGSAVIGVAGGTVTSADGRLTITVPPSTYRRPTTITIKPLTPAPAGAVGTTYDVAPAQEPFAAFQPGRPKVTLKYTAADLAGGQPSDLQFAVWRFGRWELLDSRVKASAMEISAELTSLGPVSLIGGLCEACYDGNAMNGGKPGSACTAETCTFGEAKTPGDCVTYGMGCSRCVPKCDTDRDGFCTRNIAPSFETGGDCAEGNPNIYPGAPELCNGVDDNCNDVVDEGCTACGSDAECTVPGQYCNRQTKLCEICTDTCAGGAGAACTLYPNIAGVCFGYGNLCARCVVPADTDGDQRVGAEDCDPANPNVHVGAPEVCGNMIDDDCDGAVDDNCACTSDATCAAGAACINGACIACTTTCNPATCQGTCADYGNACTRCAAACDTDKDGSCSPADCSPNDPKIYPEAIELCGDNVDNNCNGHTDEGCTACASDADCKEGNEFCNDAGACDVCPFACDPANCGFEPPPETPLVPRAPGMCRSYGVGCSQCVPTCDADGDDFCATTDPQYNPMYTQIKVGDCGPMDPNVYPGAPERCGNNIDDDCDGAIDEDCALCNTSAMCTMDNECSNSK